MKFIVETISCSETENTEYFHQLGLQDVTLTWVTEEQKIQTEAQNIIRSLNLI